MYRKLQKNLQLILGLTTKFSNVAGSKEKTK